MNQALEEVFGWIEEIHGDLRLPGVSKGTFMKRPSLRHRGKSIIGSKDGKSLVVHCPLELKDILLESEPDIYFETDYYKGYPALLIRPEKIDRERLRRRIESAWQMNATKAQLAAYHS